MAPVFRVQLCGSSRSGVTLTGGEGVPLGVQRVRGEDRREGELGERSVIQERKCEVIFADLDNSEVDSLMVDGIPTVR